MIEVSRLKDLNAAKLFLGFRIGPSVVATLPFFQYRVNADKMSVGAQMVVVLKAFVERCVSLVLGHPFECSWLDVCRSGLTGKRKYLKCDTPAPEARNELAQSEASACDALRLGRLQNEARAPAGRHSKKTSSSTCFLSPGSHPLECHPEL